MQRLGVIEPVEIPTEWCAGMVVVPNHNGRVRICVDLTKLNENVYREQHPPSDPYTDSRSPGFLKLDANSGILADTFIKRIRLVDHFHYAIWTLPLQPLTFRYHLFTGTFPEENVSSVERSRSCLPH